ncbi:MAG: DUF983 domain-containing protein [Pseudomonadota bacterium]
MRGFCPHCGQGKLFAGYLAVQKQCSVCGLDLAFADSGDGPAFFVMSITGLVAVVVLAVLLSVFEWVAGAALLTSIAVSLILTFVLLRPAKGLLIGIQYKNGAAEGRLE